MYKLIACILLLNTSALLSMSKFVCCGKVQKEKQPPVLIKQVFDFEVRTPTNPNGSIKLQGGSDRTFSHITLTMGSTFIKASLSDIDGLSCSVVSDDALQDQYENYRLKIYRDVLIDKLKKPADSHLSSGLNNCKGKLTVTCTPDDLYGPTSKNHTYEIEVKETALKEEEHKNNE